MTEPANKGMTFGEKALRHGASEIASTPGAIPAIIGLGEVGVRMLAGQDFADAALSDDGRRIKALIDNEKLPSELRQAAADMFDPTKHLNWGLRNANEWYEFGTEWGGNIDKKLGLADGPEFERRPGEVPLDEEIAGITLAALPGLPAKVVASMAAKIGQTMGRGAAVQFAKRVAQTAPGRISGKVVGAVGYTMPGTFPWTPGNVALNVGAQTALNDVMRNLTGETSLIGEVTGENERIRQAEAAAPVTAKRAREAAAVEVELNGIDEPPTSYPETGAHRYIDYGNLLLTGGLTGAAILGAAAIRGRVASPSAGRSFFDKGTPINANLTTSTPKLDQTVSSARVLDNQLFDSDSALISTARKAGGDAAAERMEVLIATNTRAGAEQGLNNIATTGFILDTGIQTVPTRKLQSAIESLSKKRTFTHGITALKGADSEYEFYSIATQARQVLKDREGMRLKAADAVRKRAAALARMIGSGRYNARQIAKQMSNLNNAQATQAATANIRPAFENLSDADLMRMSQIAELHPRMREIEAMQSKYYKDMLDAAEKLEIISTNKKQELLTRYSYQARDGSTGLAYRPLNEDPEAGTSSFAVRRFLDATKSAFKDVDTGKNTGQPLNERELDPQKFIDAAAKGEPRKVVNNPGDIVASMYNYTGNILRNATTNAVVREFVELMANSPATNGGLRKIRTVSRAQLRSGRYDPPTHAVAVQRGNVVEYWEFADKVLADALAFDPYYVTPFLNATRRIYQSGTTGPLAPFWAPKGFFFDYFTAQVTKPKGRSLGFIDAAVHKLSNERLGIPGDPTFLLESIVGVGRGMYGSMTKAAGEWFANDLAESSSVFAEVVKSAVGKQWLENVGIKLQDRYLRSTLGIMDHYGRFGANVTSLKSPHDVGLMNSNFSNMIGVRAWMGMVNSIHNGVKIAYFTRNIAEARRSGPVPLDKIREIAHEARTLAGDMSKSGKSTTMNAITSSMPYSNVAIQSMRHVIVGSMQRAAAGDTRPLQGLFFGVFLPAFASIHALSRLNESEDGRVLDWYYNQLPSWERIGNIIMPNPMSDNEGPFDPATDIIAVPIAPETVPLAQAAIALAESFGVIDGDQRVSGGMQADVLDGMSSLANLAMPPAVNAAIEGTGGRAYLSDVITGIMTGKDRPLVGQKPGLDGAVFEDQMRLNSDITANQRDALAALFGTTMRIAVEAVDAGMAADNADQSIWSGMSQTLQQFSFETQKRTPVANRPLFGIDTKYKGTPMTDKYVRTIAELESVFKMSDNQSVGEVGGKTKPAILYPISERPETITKAVDGISPEQIRAAVTMSKQMLQNPQATHLAGEMGRIDRSITMVDGARATDPRKRNELLNELYDMRHRTATALYTTVVQPWEQALATMLGKPVDAQEFVSIMRRSVGE